MKEESKNPDCGCGGGGKQEENPLYSGTYYAVSARIKACEGKKYGDRCTWVDNQGRTQTGKCVYDKWGWSPGPLFCAKADYKEELDGIDKKDE